jgi:hypothetical protein
MSTQTNMEEPRDNTPSMVVNIATDGDVILVVGPEKAKLRVQSLFLKAASKPFPAMFGPDWKEGHDILDLREPVGLSLPEDNASALKLVCAIIHQYDCVQALKFGSGSWLWPDKNEAGGIGL